jgi:hypothetical protein
MKKWFFVVIVPFLVSSVVSANDGSWVLLSEEENGKYQIYYKRDSIKKIDKNTFEVYDVTAKPAWKTFRQLRINCINRQYAIGRTELFSDDAKTPYQTFDFSKQGWMWFVPDDVTMKQLVGILCDRKYKKEIQGGEASHARDREKN